MSVARSTVQVLRTRAAPTLRQTARSRGTGHRFNSTNAGPNASASVSPALAGAAAGAGAAVVIGYGAYKLSGVDTAVQTYQQTKSYFNSASAKLKEATPAPNEALEALRSTANHYAAFIPGGKAYVDTAFKDIDSIRAKHGDEIDKIVSDTYSQLKKLADAKGFSLEGASQSWVILQESLQKITDLAGDAAEDILKNHPSLKENVDKLKAVGEKYGPDAKKQVDEVYKEINDIVKSGVSFDTIGKVKSLIDRKQKDLAKLGDVAWEKGLEQAKPYLDKAPQVKELVEKNKDALLNGDLMQLWEKIKSGNSGDIESYIKDAASKAKDVGDKATGGSMDKYLALLPGLGSLAPQFSKLKEVAEHKGDDAKELLEKTIKDLEVVLKKRLGEAEKLAKDSKKEATK